MGDLIHRKPLVVEDDGIVQSGAEGEVGDLGVGALFFGEDEVVAVGEVLAALGHEGVAAAEQAHGARLEEHDDAVGGGLLLEEVEHLRADGVEGAVDLAVTAQVGQIVTC